VISENSSTVRAIIEYITDVQPLIDSIISTINIPENFELKNRITSITEFRNFIVNNQQTINTEIVGNIQKIARDIYNTATGKLVNQIGLNQQFGVYAYIDFVETRVYYIERANETYTNGKLKDFSDTVKIYFDNLVKKIGPTKDAINTLISTLDSEYNTLNDAHTTKLNNYNQKLNERYGTGGTEANPTGGTRKTYFDDLNTFYLKRANLSRGLETAVPTAGQMTTAETNRYNRILKIDKYNRVTRLDSSYLYECTGIAFDSDNRMFVVDHYDMKVYMIRTDGNRYKSNLLGIGVPYGIAVDNNPTVTNRNVYVSFNKWDVSYNINALKGHYITNLKYDDISISPNPYAAYVVGETNMEATPTDYNKYYGTHMYGQVRLKNPGLISIDSSNRIIFTQTGLHNVLMTFLINNNLYNTRRTKGIITYNIKTIRIEPASTGNGISLKSIYIDVGEATTADDMNISNTSFNSSKYSVNDGTTNIFPYTPNATQKQYIVINFNNTTSVKTIKLYADSDKVQAVGMNVILYDFNKNIISNRKTTYDILNQGGCELNYDSVTETNEDFSQ
jgi:hypothetical protein